VVRNLPLTVAQVSADWLTGALGVRYPGVRVERLATDRIIWGTATKVFVRAGYAPHDRPLPPPRLCVKGGFREELRSIMARGYQTEALFYRDVAPRLSDGLPPCHYADVDPEHGQGIVVLDDLAEAGGRFVDARVPLTTDVVAAGLEVMAGWHARTDITEPWLDGPPNIRDLVTMVVQPEHWDTCMRQDQSDAVRELFADRDRVVRGFRAVWAAEDAGHRVLTHGDANVTNVYLDAGGAPTFVDWQFPALNSWAHDVTAFLVGSLDVAERRANEQALLRNYLAALAGQGGPDPGWDAAWRTYRCHHLHGATYALTPDEMQPADVRAANADRYAAAALDHDTLGLLGV
jgi:hypothetical protein